MKKFYTKKQLLEESKYKNMSSKDAVNFAKKYNEDKKTFKSFDSQYGDISKECFDYLELVRKSGIVNMFMAADLLWSGREFIEKYVYINAPHLHDDDEYDEYDEDDEDDYMDGDDQREAYQEVLEQCDYIRNLLIRKAVELSDTDDIRVIQNKIRKIGNDINSKWIKFYGTKWGSNRTSEKDIEEGGRTLARARKKRLYPDVAKKNNPMRFRPADRLNENVGEKCKCKNCGHSWVIEAEDPNPKLCHMCGLNNDTNEFEIEKLRNL